MQQKNAVQSEATTKPANKGGGSGTIMNLSLFLGGREAGGTTNVRTGRGWAGRCGHGVRAQSLSLVVALASHAYFPSRHERTSMIDSAAVTSGVLQLFSAQAEPKQDSTPMT